MRNRGVPIPRAATWKDPYYYFAIGVTILTALVLVGFVASWLV